MELEELSTAKENVEKELSALKVLYRKDAQIKKNLVLQDSRS